MNKTIETLGINTIKRTIRGNGFVNVRKVYNVMDEVGFTTSLTDKLISKMRKNGLIKTRKSSVCVSIKLA